MAEEGVLDRARSNVWRFLNPSKDKAAEHRKSSDVEGDAGLVSQEVALARQRQTDRANRETTVLAVGSPEERATFYAEEQADVVIIREGEALLAKLREEYGAVTRAETDKKCAEISAEAAAECRQMRAAITEATTALSSAARALDAVHGLAESVRQKNRLLSHEARQDLEQSIPLTGQDPRVLARTLRQVLEKMESAT
jgi:hypothetical protein